MKLSSILFLFANAKASFLKFPLALVSSAIAVGIAIYLTEHNRHLSDTLPLINTMLCAMLGIPLYFCVTVFSLKNRFDQKIRWLLALLATLILVAVFLTLPDADSTHNTTLPYVKYTIYSVVVHLSVCFVPFIHDKGLNGYWQYNKLLFMRLCTSALYSAVLYLGLALALGSLKLLFDIRVHQELFFDMFLIVAGIFNTLFFLSGIPADLNNFDELNEYPKGLKVFSQYILLPLLVLFLIILYLYGSKILVLWQWPKGVVSYLIVGSSVLGILTFLLLYPYGNMDSNAWIKRVSRGYYVALAPLLAILFIAIGMRTNEYGITISRYVIILLGIWLSVLCFYTITGKPNIKFIPASLAFALLISSFGPWGMFSASEKSQVNRLKKILEVSGILKNGKIDKETLWITDSIPEPESRNRNSNEGILNDSLHNEVYSILHYLDDNHGFCSIRDWYKQNLDSILTSVNVKKSRYNQQDEADFYMSSLGLTAQYVYEKQSSDFYSAQAHPPAISDIRGFDYMFKFDFSTFGHDSLTSSFTLDSLSCTCYSVNANKPLFFIKCGNQKFRLNLDSLVASLSTDFGQKNENSVPPAKLRLTGSAAGWYFRTDFDYINMEKGADSLAVSFFSGTLFIGRKQLKTP